MKKFTCVILTALLLTGCAAPAAVPELQSAAEMPAAATQAETTPAAAPTAPPPDLSDAVDVEISDSGIQVDGQEQTDAVFVSHDIIYYQDLDTYSSGNPYGEGTASDRHSAEQADAHSVVNITKPGSYRIHGTLSAGQIRVDLGEDAAKDPNAVVNLILDGADITCTVAPAILFLHVYECDGSWSEETASAQVDTSAAGANLILADGSRNTVNGSYVAKIYKDNADQKKLWKQDGAVYSYMSMNVAGNGSLDITAENEGLDTELHLTINGGNITILSGNDGINTNEDGVSVTTINGGNIHIVAGLGAEGDGVDSNGYLVINGGTVVSAGNPQGDSGLDSDKGSFINGGTVVALGSTMDWAESDSNQVTMNLQFAADQKSDDAIVVTKDDGSVIFAYDPGEDEILKSHVRQYSGAIISSQALTQGETYKLYIGGTLTGSHTDGLYDIASITGYAGGIQQMFTGSDLRRGGRGGFGRDGDHPQMPDDGQFTPGERGKGQRPDGSKGGHGGGWERGEKPEGQQPQLPDGATAAPDGSGSSAFYMQDKVNAFTGVQAASAAPADTTATAA